jgi:hypothetical protein
LQKLSFLMVFIAAVLSAMACDTRIAAEEYDQSCTDSADCSVVPQGDVCHSSCLCFDGAVANAEAARYQADREALEAQCVLPDTDECGFCGDFTARCEAGKCTTVAEDR